MVVVLRFVAAFASMEFVVGAEEPVEKEAGYIVVARMEEQVAEAEERTAEAVVVVSQLAVETQVVAVRRCGIAAVIDAWEDTVVGFALLSVVSEVLVQRCHSRMWHLGLLMVWLLTREAPHLVEAEMVRLWEVEIEEDWSW